MAATTYTWTGGGADSNWATGGNWDNGTPSAGGNLVFPATTTKPGSNNNLPAGTAFGAIQINGSGYNLSGNALGAQSITLSNASGSNTIGMGLQGQALTINTVTAGTQLSLQGINITQSVTFTGGGTATVNNFIVGGVFGTTSLTKDGTGTLILQTPSSIVSGSYVGNNWLGSCEIKAGTLQLGKSDQFPRLSTVNVDAGAVLDLEDFSDACGGLAGAGAVNRHGVANSTHLFTVGANNTSTVFSGVLSDSGGFQKIGTGALIMSGNSPFTGTIIAEVGSVSITGTMSAAIFSLKSNGVLQGAGTIGAISGLGGTLGAGTPTATGVLNTGNINFNGSGTLALRLNGNTPGTGYDQISVTGTVNVTGVTLSLKLGFNSNAGDQFTILNNDGSDAIVGTFAGLAEGARFAASGNEFTISYAGGDGNDIVLTNVSGAASGTIRDGSGKPVAGVTISNGNISTTTAADGTYQLSIADGSVTITPSLAGYTFTPPNRVVTGTGSSIPGQDFTATQILANVSGQITFSDGSGLQGAIVSDGTRFGTSDVSGNYTISGVPFGEYTLTPSRAGFIFTPPMLDVVVAGDTTGQNFSVTRSSPDSALPLNVKKLSFKLNFATPGNDTFSLQGTVDIPAGFVVQGQQVQLLLGNISKEFTLDSKGNAKSGLDSMKLTVKVKKKVVLAQSSTFTVKGGKGNYVTGLAGTGIANVNATKMSVSVPVLMIFNSLAFGKNQPQVFSAKVGKTGSTK